jgi:hypothetical protein
MVKWQKVVEYDRGSDVYMVALENSKYKDVVPNHGRRKPSSDHDQ